MTKSNDLDKAFTSAVATYTQPVYMPKLAYNGDTARQKALEHAVKRARFLAVKLQVLAETSEGNMHPGVIALISKFAVDAQTLIDYSELVTAESRQFVDVTDRHELLRKQFSELLRLYQERVREAPPPEVLKP